MKAHNRRKPETGRENPAKRHANRPRAKSSAERPAPSKRAASLPKGRKARTPPPSEEDYRSLFENIPDGIYRTTQDGRILAANLALAQMFGYDNEEEFKRKFRADQLYLRPADRQVFLQRLEEHGEIRNSEIVLKRRDGSPLIALENVRIVRDGRGKTLYYEGVLIDITERKRIEDSLRESQLFSQAILENSPLGISVRSHQGHLISANSAWKKIWGVTESELQEETVMPADLQHDTRYDYLSGHKADVQRVYEQGGRLHLPELQTGLTRLGAAEWVAQHFYAIQDARGQVDRVVILTEDITERKRAATGLLEANRALQEALERERVFARTDSLTGVYTRRHFFDITHHAFAAAKRGHHPLSVIMFDIDLFKHFNDTHGHQAGDELLKSVAHTAQRQLRDADILARYGGDEFVILLSNSNAGEAQQAGERIRASIAALRLEIDNVPMQITLSLGIAEYSAEVGTVDQLVQRADRALYSAKESGRNCVVVFQEQ